MAKKRVKDIDMGTIETPVGVLPVEFHIDTNDITFGSTYANGGTPSPIRVPGYYEQQYMGWFSCTIDGDGGIAYNGMMICCLYSRRTGKHASEKAHQDALEAVRKVIEAWVTEHWAEMYRPVLEQERDRLTRLARSQREQAARRIATAEEAELSIVDVTARLGAIS